MWWSDRRVFLAGLASAIASCGFEPVYGPGGAGNALLGQIQVDAPDTPRAYIFTRRFEERMGRAPSPRYRLSLRLTADQTGFGSISSGATTRYRINGEATYALRDAATDVPLLSGKTRAFTGYSTSGSTVATLSGERDAIERLMVILADQVIDALLLDAPDLPA